MFLERTGEPDNKSIKPDMTTPPLFIGFSNYITLELLGGSLRSFLALLCLSIYIWHLILPPFYFLPSCFASILFYIASVASLSLSFWFIFLLSLVLLPPRFELDVQCVKQVACEGRLPLPYIVRTIEIYLDFFYNSNFDLVRFTVHECPVRGQICS